MDGEGMEGLMEKGWRRDGGMEKRWMDGWKRDGGIDGDGMEKG